MSCSKCQSIIAEINEKEIFSINFIEKEVIVIDLSSDTLTCSSPQIVEKEIIVADIVEKEIISTEFRAIDVLFNNRIAEAITLIQEEPIRLTLNKFRTEFIFISGTIKVFVNGLKVKINDVIELDSRTFQVSENLILSDYIEVEYIKIP